MVTIIMPAYNCERFLRDAVESVKEQTYTDWKLLIIDDCSKDRTKALAEKLANSDDRIIVLHNKENSGVSKTRNRGIQESESEWIAFLDSDDMWEPEKLEKQFNLIAQKPEAKLLFTGSGFMKESGERLEFILHVPEQIDRRELLKQNLISCSSVLVKRESLLKHPMPEKKDMHEDFTVWLSILREEQYAYGIDEPLLIYRRSENSKSGNKLKAARMNWNAYREVGLGVFEATYYMCWYVIRALKKYSKLK